MQHDFRRKADVVTDIEVIITAGLGTRHAAGDVAEHTGDGGGSADGVGQQFRLHGVGSDAIAAHLRRGIGPRVASVPNRR